MITYKLVLDERRAKADGKFPIMFRITFNRRTTNYSSGISVLKEHWNKQTLLLNRTCPNYKELNQSLSVKFLKVQRFILELENKGTFSFDGFKELYNEKPKPAIKAVTFAGFAKQMIDQMIEDKRAGNASVYQTALNRLISFSGNERISINEVDYLFIEDFKRQLSKDGVKVNTIGNYLRSIRAIWNKAMKSNIADKNLYPFQHLSIETERTAKRAASMSDLRKIYERTYKQNSPKWHARNYFLLSFALRGASFIDMAFLTPDNLKDGYVSYRRQKTDSALQINIVPLATELLSYYQRADAPYLLPVFKQYVEPGCVESKSIVRQWIKTTNKWLKRIAEDCGLTSEITTYVTRHSWATAAKRLGYSNELIAECLGHQYGNKVTNTYLDSFDITVLNALNQCVLGCILPCPKATSSPVKYVIVSGTKPLLKPFGKSLTLI